MPKTSCLELPVLSLEQHAAPEGADSVIHTLRLAAPGWAAWQPGQFVMLRCKGARQDLIWARPFSISRADETELRIVFQVAGRGTEALRGVLPGDMLDVWGPLGNGFALAADGPTLLLAGGIGIAPFVGYIETHPAPETLSLEFGHRLPLDCYPFTDCCAINARSYQDCGPDDLACFLESMEESIRGVAAENGLVLACGPMPFLRSVQDFSLRHKARAQVSLETRMACGVGACLGCVVKSKAGKHKGSTDPEAFAPVQVCTCGPVFWADEVDLDW